MRRLRNIVLGGMVLTLMLVLAMCAALMPEEESTSCEDESTQNVGDPDQLTVKGIGMNDQQQQNAQDIIDVAVENNLPQDAAIIAIMTAIQESTLSRLPFGYPGSTSIGLFQQIEAWGPYEDRIGSTSSAEMFFLGGQAGQSGLTDIDSWEDMGLGEAAQAVQQSGYPDAYDQHEAEARQIVATLLGTSTSGKCIEDPVETMITAALSRVDDPYSWNQTGRRYDGASFLSWAANEAEFSIPESIGALASFEGDTASGVTAEFVPAGTGFEPERGDILLWSSNPSETERSDAARAGIYLGSSFDKVRVGTYNTGPGSGMDRKAAELRAIMDAQQIDVIGLQEVETLSEFRELQSPKFLGDRYGIYPSKATRMHRNSEETRPIVYNRQRYKVVKSDMLTFPRMGGERIQPGEAPVVWLEDNFTDQTIIIASTHNPAYPRFAGERATAAERYMNAFSQLRSEGFPMFFVGDLNEGTAVRKPGMGANTTYQWRQPNAYRNLFFCQATQAKLFKAAGRPATCPNPPARTGVDFIYVPPEASVSEYREMWDVMSDHPLIFADVAGPSGESGAESDGLGAYVGANPKTGTISVSDASTEALIGAIRLTVTEPVQASGDSGPWQRPLPEGSYPPITNGYLGYYGHNGVDMSAPGGTPISSMTAGEVVRSGYYSGWGNMVVVDIGDEWLLYAHMVSIESNIEVGSRVEAGQLLGAVGTTGTSTGDHLHLAVCTILDLCLAGRSSGGAGSTEPLAYFAGVGVEL